MAGTALVALASAGCSVAGAASTGSGSGLSPASSATSSAASHAASSSTSSEVAVPTPPHHLSAHTLGLRLSSAVADPVVLTRGSDLLVVGGLTASDTTTSLISSIDPTAGTVTPAGHLAEGVHDAAGAVVSGRVIVVGGGSTTVSSSVQDVTPGRTPRIIGHLPHPRADLVATTTGGAAYLLGGYDGSTELAGVLRTRDGHGFTTVAHLPLTVRYPALTAADGALWVFGGEHAGRATTAVQRIDLTTGDASVVAHLPRPLSHAGAFTLERGIYLAGGLNGSSPTAQILRFAPSTRRFATAGRLPTAMSDFGTAASGGTVYLVGGKGTGVLASIVEVRP